MKKLLFLQKANYFFLGLLFPFIITTPIVAYLCGLYLFTDFEKIKKIYPVWERKSSEELWKVGWQKSKPKHWIHLREISPAIQRAVLASEDAKFYQHFGIDMDSLYEVIRDFVDQKGHARLRGASTISQQVVKNLFFNNERSYWRKIKEVILTIKMEKTLTKREILELYFNIAEWGRDLYGIKAACSLYFKKHPSLANYKEAAFLAMLLPNPKLYAISFHKKQTTRFAKARIGQILRHLLRSHHLSQESYLQELGRPLPWEPRPLLTPPAGPPTTTAETVQEEEQQQEEGQEEEDDQVISEFERLNH